MKIDEYNKINSEKFTKEQNEKWENRSSEKLEELSKRLNNLYPLHLENESDLKNLLNL